MDRDTEAKPTDRGIPVISWIRSWPPARQDAVLVVAVILAQFIAFGSSIETIDPDTEMRSLDIWAYLIVAGSTVPLIVRRSAPFVALVLSVVGLVGFASLQYEAGFTGYAVLVALYSVVVYRGLRIGALSGLIAAAGAWTAYELSPLPTSTAGRALDIVIVVVAVALGDGTRNRIAAVRIDEDRLALIAAEHARQADEAVAEERTRIARELHDLVAHSMSVIAVQAGMGHHVIDNDPDRAKEALSTIEHTSRQALTEMRRMLGILRTRTDQVVTDLAPQPGLDRLAGLIDEVRDSGVPVEFEVEGDSVDLDPGVDLSAFRIVQEALTNVMKHAGQASVTVRLAYGNDAIDLVVEDDGRGLSTMPDGHVGLGLVGMRERAAVVGGHVETGPRPGGGFRISAHLPYQGGE